MPHPDSDDELITRAAAGDRRAFDAIVERHAPAVLRLARAMSSDDATAEDVVQEAFVAAFRSASTYRVGVASVRTWLFAIARNAARRARRGHREELTADPELMTLGLEAGWGGSAVVEAVYERDRLAQAVASLPPEDREIIVLRDLEGLSGEAAAEILGLGLAAMKSRLHRARLKLLAALRASEGGVVENERDVGGLTCSAVLERLGDYVDGDLPRPDVVRVDAHLRECSVCERFGGRYARVVHTVRAGLGAPAAIEAAQLERIRRLLLEG